MRTQRTDKLQFRDAVFRGVLSGIMYGVNLKMFG